MSDEEETPVGPGPFREAVPTPPAKPPGLSIPAALSAPVVTAGWVSSILIDDDLRFFVSGSLLMIGGILGLVGLIDTRVPLEPPVDGQLVEAKRGRTAAKLGLGCLVGPIVLGAIAFGLLLLTCMGH